MNAAAMRPRPDRGVRFLSFKVNHIFVLLPVRKGDVFCHDLDLGRASGNAAAMELNDYPLPTTPPKAKEQPHGFRPIFSPVRTRAASWPAVVIVILLLISVLLLIIIIIIIIVLTTSSSSSSSSSTSLSSSSSSSSPS